MNAHENTYRSCTYELVRRLKACPEFAGLSDKRVGEIVDIAVHKIAPKGHPDPWSLLLPDSDLFGNDVDPQLDFLSTWQGVRRPKADGQDDLEIAWRKSVERPVELPEDAGPYRNPSMTRFMSLAVYLQEVAPGGYIILPQARIAVLMERSQQAVSMICRMALKLGWLKVSLPYDREQHRATRYACLLKRANDLY